MQLNSESVLKGAERAPNRSLFYALGYTDKEINRPLIGVVSAYSEIVPGHAHLDKLAEAVKAGDGERAAGLVKEIIMRADENLSGKRRRG